MHLFKPPQRDYSLEILDFTNTSSLEIQRSSVITTPAWQSGVFTATLQSSSPVALPLCVQESSHIYITFMTSLPLQVPLPIWWPTHLLKQWLIKFHVHKENYGTSEKFQFPKPPSQRFRCSWAGMGSRRGVVYKLSDQLPGKHGGTLKAKHFEFFSAHHFWLQHSASVPLLHRFCSPHSSPYSVQH